MYSPFIFVKKLLQIYERYGVDVSDDVTTLKAIRCANDVPMIRYFGVLKFLSQQLTCYKTICKENLVRLLFLTLI